MAKRKATSKTAKTAGSTAGAKKTATRTRKPKATSAAKTTAAKKATPAKKAAPAKTTATKKAAPAKKAPVKKTAAKAPVAKKAPAKKAAAACFEMHKNPRGRFNHFFVLLGPNNEQLLRSEGFISEAECEKAIAETRRNVNRSSRVKRRKATQYEVDFCIRNEERVLANSGIFYDEGERDTAILRLKELVGNAKVVRK